LIITLTSIPPRMKYLPQFFTNLARQKLKPDAVELYVADRYRRFPGEVPSLPSLPSWVSVTYLDDDLGPATKVLPAARKWRGKQVDLLFCDDDRLYDPGWTTRFAAARRQSGDALCEQGRQLPYFGLRACQSDRPERPQPRDYEPGLGERLVQRLGLSYFFPRRPNYLASGFFDAFEGLGGVMIRPDWFDNSAYDIPPVLWTVDDIWLSGQVIRAGRDIRSTDGARRCPTLWLSHSAAPLYKHVEEDANRAEANRRCIIWFQDTYGIWLPT
jgi:hypothetical protein